MLLHQENIMLESWFSEEGVDIIGSKMEGQWAQFGAGADWER